MIAGLSPKTACSGLQEGEVVWEWKMADEELRTYSRREMEAEPDPEKRANLLTYSYMLDDDVYGSTFDPEEDVSYYFNHTCDPNCWYRTDNYLVASRDIAEGEHVSARGGGRVESCVLQGAGAELAETLCGPSHARGVLPSFPIH
jgi:hypothetical protein